MNMQQRLPDEKMAKMAMEFLKRVNLTGDEVPAFTAVNQWLATMSQPAAPVPEHETPVTDEKKG